MWADNGCRIDSVDRLFPSKIGGVEENFPTKNRLKLEEGLIAVPLWYANGFTSTYNKSAS